MHRSRAFTLVEMLVVVSIVLILLGLLVPTVHLLRRSQYRTVTAKTMEALTRAVTMYVHDYASLGSQPDSSDFVAAPLRFLYCCQQMAGRKPYLEPSPQQRIRSTDPEASRVRSVGTGSVTVVTDNWQEANPRESTHITDNFGRQILIWRVLNGETDGRFYPRLIEIRSQAGTEGDPSDDLIYIQVLGDEPVAFDGNTYPGTDGDWQLVRQQDL